MNVMIEPSAREKLLELDRLLNDETVAMEPGRIWELAEQLAQRPPDCVD